MSEKEERKFSTTSVYSDDLPRIHALRKDRPNRRKYEPYKEEAANVISRALDALEALERESSVI